MLPDLGQQSLCWDPNGLLGDEANNRDGGRGSHSLRESVWDAETLHQDPSGVIHKDVLLATAA